METGAQSRLESVALRGRFKFLENREIPQQKVRNQNKNCILLWVEEKDLINK